jgi:large repetitive protein
MCSPIQWGQLMFRSKFDSFGLRSSAVVSLSAITLFAMLNLSGCGAGNSTPPAMSVTVTSSAATVDATDSVTLTAAVANDTTSGGVTWTVTGGGALSNTSTSGATYTAPAASSSAVTATVTATSVADATKTGTTTLTVPPTPTVTTGPLTANVGTAYSTTLAGAGGIPPYKWTLTSGTLPTSWSLTSAGVLSGPAPLAGEAGATNLTFALTDSGTATAATASQQLALTINPAPAIVFASSLSNGTFNSSYSATVVATGGAGTLTYTLAGGSLPTGLTLSTAGVITGMPSVAGTFPITVKAADAFGDSATNGYSITVTYPQLKVTAATLPTGYVNSNYAGATLAATGGSGSGYTWALANGSALPAGLHLSASGAITGQPTATTPASFTATVTDSASNTASGTFSITIDAALSITTPTTLPTGYVGANYSKTLAATGGSGTGYTWALASGSNAPAGTNFTAAGVLTGKPTTAGSPSFAVTVTDSASNTATATFTITISAGVSITSASTLPAGYQGTAYPGATLTATGGSGTGFTWTWAPASGSSLPAGLLLSTGGAITGLPTASGTSSIIVTVTDSASNTASATVSLTVTPTLTITTSATLHGGVVGTAYSATLAATGGSGSDTWSTNTAGTTSLAAIGLSLSSGGVVSGASPTLGTAIFTGTVTDSASHTASLAFSVTVSNALAVTTGSLPAAYAGTLYSQTLAAAGGSGTGYTWTATSSNLATYGLTLSSAGLLSGTPATSGTVSFTAKVTDSASNTATQAFSFAVYNALSLPAPNPNSLGAGTTGEAYTGTISASGGSGNYTWTVTSLPSDGLSSSSGGGTLTISGTPTTATTVSFGVKLTDTTTGISVGPFTYSILVSNPPPLALPAPNPSSLPSATVGQSYSGSITATGGVPPYTWTVTGLPSNSLSSSSSGNNLSVTGTPTTMTGISFTASVTDSASHTAGPNTYTISVNSAGSQVSGQIFLTSGCGGSVTVPTITVSINTNPVQTTTTDNNGNYSFASIPNGTYTITPSITGPSSAFYPASYTGVVVNNGAVSGENFSASLGYTVSGTVSYTGASTGQVYLVLNSGCGGSGGPGTSITAPGSFSIRGVAPGSYTLQSWMDTIGQGGTNAADPSGSTASVSVASANVTGADVSLTDPSVTTPTSGPQLQNLVPNALGVNINYGPVTNSNGEEVASSYVVEWSTTSTFTSTSSHTFKANGNGADVWILNSGLANFSGALTNGTAYYFRARAVNTAGTSTWSVWGGSTPVAVTIGAPSGTGYSTVTGSVTIPSGVTPTGPLYVGFYNQNNGSIYGVRIASPSNSSPNNFTVNVPTDSNPDYFFFGILDQNNDGMIDGGDVTNTNNNGNSNGLAVPGNLSNQDITLPTANSTLNVTTQFQQNTCSGCGGVSSSYSLSFDLRKANKVPVAATLISGPNVIQPVDLGACGNNCGNPQFQYYANIGSVVPKVNDSYSLQVTYSDGTSETVNGSITGVLTASQLATNLAPTGTGGSTTPTFTWTYPANASNYIYQFYICCDSNGTIWQIPGNNSNLNGFPSSVTQIVWGTDPTGNTGNTPSDSSLTSGTNYNWQLGTQDSNGNQAQTSVFYIP